MKRYPLNIFAKLYFYWLIFVFFFIEFISYLHLISREIVVLGNLIFFVGFIFIYRDGFKKINFSFLQNKFNLIICLILLLIFIQGFFSAPNTTDAMTYHITRTMYWIQEKTVSQSFIRSSHDFQPPFAEYILMNLYLILNSDRLLFLSEWLAFAVAVYLSGVLAYRLGASGKAINLVRLLVVTIPIAILQASSTQVDLLTNVLALFGLYFVLNLITEPKIKDSLILGIITGLGLQVKSPFMFHILIPLGLLGIFKVTKLKREIYIFLIIFLVTLLMQVRYWNQNMNLYGSALGQNLSGEQNRYVNDRFDPSALLGNVTRNLLNQFPVPVFASLVESGLGRFLNLIGTDLQDPTITYPGLVFHVSSVVYPQEDIASSPIHLLLIILALGLVYRNREKIKSFNVVAGILIIVAGSFILFSYVLKYEPYHPRLQIPYFTIGTIVSVMILLSYKWGSRFLTLILIPSIVLGFALIFLNVLRPYISYSSFYSQIKGFAPPNSAIPEAFYLKPRDIQYFNARPYLYEPYDKVTDLIALNPGFKYIVLKLSGDEFEYPLWALLKEKNIDFYIQQNKFVDNPVPKNAIILTTSETSINLEGYNTKCFKTYIEYGYACLSKKEN